MENLGEFLRQQREEKNVSVEELATRTRIAVRFIRLMEENQFDQLPNPVSAKGFLRSYARCLGLEEAPILNRFSQVFQLSGATANGAQEKVPSYIQRKQPDHLPFPLWAALSVIGVIVLFLVLAFLMPKRKETTPPPPPPEEILSDEPIPPEPSPIPPPPEAGGAAESPEPPPVSPTPTSAVTSAPAPEESFIPLVLLIEAREQSWVHATVDGTEIKEALLQPGESVRWEAKGKFALTVGNAGGVRLFLDGRDLGSLGPSGRVVKKEIVAKR